MADDASRRLQDFFDKVKIIAKDLDSSRAKQLIKDLNVFDITHYEWLNTYLAISPDRIQRYKDYEAMVEVPELELGLTTYADDGTQMNSDGKVLRITSSNDEIVELLEHTFYDNLDINSDLWKIFLGTCKYGDNFYEVVTDYKKKEIVFLKHLYPANVERIEIDGNLLKFLVRKGKQNPQDKINRQGFTKFASTKVEQKNIVVLEPWQIVHFKIDDDMYAPYGKSVLESGRRTFKQLSLMEDAMLVYRLERAPEKRVFYIDVGNLSTAEAEKFVEKIKSKFRKTPYIDPQTGQINQKATPLSILEDFWIPVRSGVSGSQGTRIDVLQGGRQLNEIDDTKYFRDKLLKTMHIPPQYFSAEGGMDTSKSLSQMDIRFARTVERIQRHIIKGLEKIAIIALALRGYKGDDIRNFELELTPPSNIAELLELEVLSQKINLISTILGMEGFLPKKWIYENIMRFSEKEIQDILTQLQIEAAQAASAQAPEGGGMMAGPAPALAGGIGGEEIGGGLETPVGGGEETAPPEETAPGGAPVAPEAGVEVADKAITIGNKQFILENRADIIKLFKYINQIEKTAKDNNDKQENVIFTPSNSVNKQLLSGELRGLINGNKKS